MNKLRSVIYICLMTVFTHQALAQTAPSFTSSAPTGTVIYDRPFTYAFSATDGDSDPISFFVPGAQQNDANLPLGTYTGSGAVSSLWQSFTAGATGLMTSGALTTFHTNQFGGSVTANVYSGTGTGGTLLYSVSIHIPNSFTSHAFSIPLSANVVLVAGQIYTIEFNASSAIMYGTLMTGNPYAGGRSFWSETLDTPFHIKINPLTTTPAATWLTLTDNADGTGSLSGIPTVSDAGAFSETLFVKAGSDYVQQPISFTIAGPPVTVTGLQAIAGDGSVELKWRKNSGDSFSTYYIYSGSSLNPTSILDSVESETDTTFLVTEAVNGATQYFRLRTRNSDGQFNDWSPQTAATPAVSPGNSLGFNGSNSHLTIPNSTRFDTQTLTMETWVYSLNYNQNGFLFEKGPVNTQYSMFFEGANFVFRTVSNTNTIHSYSVNTVTDLEIENGNWYHIACSFDGTTKKIYVNGILKKSTETPHTLKTGQSGQTIGMFGGGGYFLNGKLDEMRIWNVVRSEEEILSSVISSLRGDEPGLVALYHFDEPAGSVAYDATIFGHHATWVNSPVSETSGAMDPLTVPVELSSFTHIGNKLIWKTASETTNAGWEVEMSKPDHSDPVIERPFDSAQGPSRNAGSGSEKWETLGFVAGAGSSTEERSYSFSLPEVKETIRVRLRQIDTDGTVSYSQILTIDAAPTEFQLLGNYPNPFNPSTVIRYQISEISDVKLEVYDVTGRIISTLVNGKQEPGVYSVSFSSNGLASGMYFYRIQAGTFTSVKSMILMK